jgi:hypothetical protein
LASFNGYVINVSLRLFTNWEGDNPLYIYSISRFPLDPKISHRYPLIPQRNNTEWQTIEIPSGKFPLSSYSHLAIGMQDNSDTNQIYAVKAPLPMYGGNITSDTNIVYSQLLNDYYGAAFTFTLFKNGKKMFYQAFLYVSFVLFRRSLNIGTTYSSMKICFILSISFAL